MLKLYSIGLNIIYTKYMNNIRRISVAAAAF